MHGEDEQAGDDEDAEAPPDEDGDLFVDLDLHLKALSEEEEGALRWSVGSDVRSPSLSSSPSTRTHRCLSLRNWGNWRIAAGTP
jgi:hypothetical protein